MHFYDYLPLAKDQKNLLNFYNKAFEDKYKKLLNGAWINEL